MRHARPVLFALLLAVPTAALGFEVRYDEKYTTAASGYEGEVHRAVTSNVGWAFRGLRIDRVDTRACALRPYWQASLEMTSGPIGAMTEGACADPSPVGHALSTSHAAFEKDSHAVRAIQVCTNAGNSSAASIQGLRIWAGQIGADGKVTPTESQEVFNTTECKTWHTKVACNDGDLAIGLKAHHDGAQYRGLALVCAPIGPAPAPTRGDLIVPRR